MKKISLIITVLFLYSKLVKAHIQVMFMYMSIHKHSVFVNLQHFAPEHTCSSLASFSWGKNKSSAYKGNEKIVWNTVRNKEYLYYTYITYVWKIFFRAVCELCTFHLYYQILQCNNNVYQMSVRFWFVLLCAFFFFLFFFSPDTFTFQYWFFIWISVTFSAQSRWQKSCHRWVAAVHLLSQPLRDLRTGEGPQQCVASYRHPSQTALIKECRQARENSHIQNHRIHITNLQVLFTK